MQDREENNDEATRNALTRTSTNVETSLLDVRTPTRQRHRSYSDRSTDSDIGQEPLIRPEKEKRNVKEKKENKGGFFRKLFGRKEDKRSKSVSSASRGRSGSLASHSTDKEPSSSLSPVRTTSKPIPPPRVLNNEETNSISSTPSSNLSPLSQRPSLVGSEDPSEIRQTSSVSSTLSEKHNEADPLLSEYLSDMEQCSKQRTSHPELSAQLKRVFAPTTKAHIKYKPGVVPAHPDLPKLPSAFAKHPKYGGSLEFELFKRREREKAQQKENAGGSGVFGGLLHRTKTNVSDNILMKIISNDSDASPPLNFKPIPYTKPPAKVEVKPPMKPLRDVKPMKKVAFATTTFVNDPPQQIPSRHPRKGNVEVGPKGELIIHNISEEERKRSTCGIVVGGSGHLRLLSEIEAEQKLKKMASRTAKDEITESVSAPGMERTPSEHTIRAEDKAAAARKALKNAHSGEADEHDHLFMKNNIKIDTPMVRRKRQMEKPVVTLKIDELYTRCCHLREILPIPATLKQIPKGSTDPIPILRLKNPSPSMIEVLAFTDFIRIAPIICLSLDGVSLTHEMLRLILSALLYKRYLEKLSLRNTPIDAEGWRMLCWFLSMNKAMKSLDVTECPSLVVNTQKVHKHKKKNKGTEQPRMVCNKDNRTDMNWPLMTASIIYRGGISELILSGCKISDYVVFKNLLDLGLPRTRKLGLAYNDLSYRQCEILTEWLSKNANCIGIDVGYNDLSGKLKPFIDYTRSTNFTTQLCLISFNCCNLLDTPDTEILFDSISKLEHLKYLDISNNKKLFPGFMNKLCMYLPIFNELSRLNFDDNGLDSISMIKLCECLPLMSHLNYLSIRGMKMDRSVCHALCHSLELSNTLYTIDFDKENVPEKYQRRFGLLTMKNMERTFYAGNSTKHENILDAIGGTNEVRIMKEQLGIPSGVNFGYAFIEIARKRAAISDEQVSKFLGAAGRLRKKMKGTISELINLQLRRKLTLEGKELLIRLVNLDSSISKCVDLVREGSSKRVYDTSAAAKDYYDKVFEDSRRLSTASPSPLHEDETVQLTSDNIPVSEDVEVANEGEKTSTEMMSDEAHVFRTNSNPDFRRDVELSKTAESAEKDDSKEKYRKILLKTRDPLDILGLLGTLKSKGLCLADIYGKGPDHVTIKNTKANARKAEQVTVMEKNNKDTSDSHEEDVPSEEIMQLYDSVLRDLVNNRSDTDNSADLRST